MFGALQDKLEGVFRNLRGLGKISESNVSDAMREVRMALLEADVDFGTAKAFIEAVKEKSLGEKVLKSVTPGQQIIKIFSDELTALLGGDASPLNLAPPGRIMMVGLNGAGKTTTSGKLALRLKREGHRPVLIACDLFRPAAIQQLATIAGEIGVPVFLPEAGEKDVVRSAKAAMKWLETQSATIVIFDTAGRQEVDDALIKELKELHAFVKPQEVLLVADAATGQQAVSVAKTFDAAIGVTGIVLTKLDGDARGGAALSMRAVTGKPIKLAGTGEKMEMLDEFVPERMAQRILGMGDVVGLVEMAQKEITEKDAEKMMERMMSDKFDFTDFLEQFKMMKKLTSGSGGMMGLLQFLPGMGQLKELKKQMQDNDADKQMRRMEAMILSMTPKERKKPEIINAKRRQRIAAGSGTKLQEVNGLMERFNQMKQMMGGGGMKGLMGMMGKMDPAALSSMMGGGGMPPGGMPPGFPGMPKPAGGKKVGGLRWRR